MNKEYDFQVEFSCSDNFFPKEKEGFRLSRSALLKLTTRSLITENLSIINHDHLESLPHVKVSISHTKSAGASIISNHSKVKGIGIDIEWSDRIFKRGVEKFYITTKDDTSLSALEIWCAKEAAYKAYFPHYKDEKPLVLKDFYIHDLCFYIGDKKLGNIFFYSIDHHFKKLTIAVAVLSGC